MSKNTVFLSRTFLMGAFCAPLILASCHSATGPYPMPSGYAHHSDVYKAPDGPEMVIENTRNRSAYDMPVPEIETQPPVRAVPAPMITPQNLDSASWQEPADRLVAGMVGDFGTPNLPVYVMAGRSVEEMELEAALKKALRGHGVDLAAERGTSPFALSYMIIEPMADHDNRKLIKIILNDYDKKIAEESALFDHIPSSDRAGTSGTAPPALMENRYESTVQEQDEDIDVQERGDARESGAMPVPLTSSLDNR